MSKQDHSDYIRSLRERAREDEHTQHFHNDPNARPYSIKSLLRAVQCFVDDERIGEDFIEEGTYEVHTEHSEYDQLFGLYVDPDEKVLHLNFVGSQFPPSPEQMVEALMRDFARHMAEKEAREATKQ